MFTTSVQQFIIGASIVLLWIGVLIILALVDIPAGNKDAFNLFLGGILGAGTTVLAFYFPSSVGARSKDEAIVGLATLAAANTPPANTGDVKS